MRTSEQFQLIKSSVLVPSDRGYMIPSHPKMHPCKILLLSQVDPRYENRTLSFDIPYYLKYGIFRGNRYQHMHVITHQMPLFNTTLSLAHQLI